MLEQLNAYTGALLLFCGALLILGCALLCMLLVRQRRQQERMGTQETKRPPEGLERGCKMVKHVLNP